MHEACLEGTPCGQPCFRGFRQSQGSALVSGAISMAQGAVAAAVAAVLLVAAWTLPLSGAPTAMAQEVRKPVQMCTPAWPSGRAAGRAQLTTCRLPPPNSSFRLHYSHVQAPQHAPGVLISYCTS